MSVLSPTWHEKITKHGVVVNELTTVGLNTLGSLITAYGTVMVNEHDWKHSFKVYTTPLGGKQPENTAEAMIGIAQSPWAHPAGLFELFNKAYPQPTDGFPAKPNSLVPASRRKAPFVPYLSADRDAGET